MGKSRFEKGQWVRVLVEEEQRVGSLTVSIESGGVEDTREGEVLVRLDRFSEPRWVWEANVREVSG